MPTPMPIIAANCGVNAGKSTKAAPRPTMRSPEPTPRIAIVIGKPMATTEPKASSRMMTAAPMPISSVRPGGLRSARWMMNPPASTWNSGVDSSFRRSSSASALDRGTFCASSAYCTLMRAILPSGDTAAELPYGEETAVTSGNLERRCARSSTCDLTVGSSMPRDAWTTTVTESPAVAGKRSSSISNRFCDSEPGNVNASAYLPAAVEYRMPRTTMISSVPPSTCQACRNANLGHRSKSNDLSLTAWSSGVCEFRLAIRFWERNRNLPLLSSTVVAEAPHMNVVDESNHRALE